MAKTIHDFGDEATVAEFRDAVGANWLDFPKVKNGTRIYIRKADTGCWHIASIFIEDSGVYIEAGAELNPAEA